MYELVPKLTAKKDNHSNLICYDEEDFESMVEFLFILSTTMQHIIIVLAILGVLLNVVAVYVLSTKESMKNTFNSLLISLYCIDSMFLLTYGYLSIDLGYSVIDNTIKAIFSRFIKLLYSVAFKASIFMTVGISHERYIAMRHPLRHRALMTSGKARRIRFLKYLIPIIVTAIILVIPEYMEFEFVWELKNETTTQGLHHNYR